MVESQIITYNTNVNDLVKNITKEDLFAYAKDYLKKHVYISSKKLGTEFLGTYYNLTRTRPNYDKIKRGLTHRFSYIIMLFTREGLIVGYNNSGLYKRVDPIIDKSLSNDSSKTKLIYYQDRFVDPNFYDVDQ